MEIEKLKENVREEVLLENENLENNLIRELKFIKMAL